MRMAAEAVAWRPGAREPSPREVLASPELSRYVVGWPRDGDQGLIAEVAGPIGAAWYRRFTLEDHGFGFVAPDIPEISIAVVPEWRGRGIGRRLMEGTMRLAADEGVHAVSLSVELDNPARRLYESLGFSKVELVGGSWTMLAPVPDPG